MLSNDDFVMSSEYGSEDDKRLSVRFSLQPRLDSKATEVEGREIYKEVEFVTILIPGDKTLSVHRPIMPVDRARFPLQYQHFKSTQGVALVGTPLAGWPLLTEGQRKELDYFNIRTVEQLANVADGLAGSMMGIMGLKDQAQKFLSASKDSAPTVRLMKELEQRDNQISALQDQINKLVESLAPTEKKGK